jgi:glycosyltransferase involved in cell wall biosynthesis
MRDSAVVLSVPVWHDVLPTVVIEALAAGRPVLGTALGGVPYLVGDTGWVVEPTAAALAEALPVARAGAAGRADAARARYESTFHPDVVIGQLLDIYRDATRDRRL